MLWRVWRCFRRLSIRRIQSRMVQFRSRNHNTHHIPRTQKTHKKPNKPPRFRPLRHKIRLQILTTILEATHSIPPQLLFHRWRRKHQRQRLSRLPPTSRLYTRLKRIHNQKIQRTIKRCRILRLRNAQPAKTIPRKRPKPILFPQLS